MNNLKYITATMATSLSFGGVAFADTLTLHVETASAAGTVRAAVYDSQASQDTGRLIAGSFTPALEGISILSFPNLAPGTYGVTLFHDQNGNEELDTNLLGAPIEPFGFSTNPKIGFSAPKFDAFKFEFDGTPQVLNITLIGG